MGKFFWGQKSKNHTLKTNRPVLRYLRFQNLGTGPVSKNTLGQIYN